MFFAALVNDAAGKLGPVNKTRTYLIGGSYFADTTDDANANLLSVVAQGYDPNGNVRPSATLSYRELYKHAKASCALTPAELEPYRLAAL